MYKKIALLGAAALFALTTSAQASGFYLGGDLGYQDMKTKSTVLDADPTSVNTSVTDHFGEGVRGGVFLGYGYCINNGFYAALEVKGSLANITNDTRTVYTDVTGTNVDTSSIKQRGGVAVTLRPGYYFSENTMIYLAAGWVYTNFKASTRDTFTNLAGVAVTTNVGGKSYWRNGAQVGVGMETNLSNNIGARVEYLHSFYENATPFASPLLVVNQKYQANEFNLGIVYTVDNLV